MGKNERNGCENGKEEGGVIEGVQGRRREWGEGRNGRRGGQKGLENGERRRQKGGGGKNRKRGR